MTAFVCLTYSLQGRLRAKKISPLEMKDREAQGQLHCIALVWVCAKKELGMDKNNQRSGKDQQ
jgi:hypothetical protein